MSSEFNGISVSIPKNIKQFRLVTNEMQKLYAEKNRRYGDAFSRRFKEFGMLSAVIRLDDKMERLKYLCQAPQDCGDESVRDTLIDLANYAVMTIMELDSLKEKSAETVSEE